MRMRLGGNGRARAAYPGEAGGGDLASRLQVTDPP